MNQHILAFDSISPRAMGPEIIVDSFAGGGGASAEPAMEAAE